MIQIQNLYSNLNSKFKFKIEFQNLFKIEIKTIQSIAIKFKI